MQLALLGQGERYLKQAIIDREPFVAMASLVSGYHLYKNPANIDIVRSPSLSPSPCLFGTTNHRQTVEIVMASADRTRENADQEMVQRDPGGSKEQE